LLHLRFCDSGYVSSIVVGIETVAMSGGNGNEACSAGGRLIAYFVVAGSTLASMAVLLLRALPTLLQD